MKIFALCGIVLFLLFTSVQFNDPDPYIWVPVYLFPAIMSYFVFRGKYFFYLLAIVSGFYLCYSLATFPPSFMAWVSDELNNESLSMKTPSMEVARESLGCMICFVFLAIYAIGYLVNKEESYKKIEKVEE